MFEVKTPEQRALARIAVDAEEGRRRLAAFMRLCWSQIEPNRLIWNWHLDALAEHLAAVSRGEIQRLVVCLPPGGSKSLSVSTLWPAWDWIDHPARRLIGSTYGQDLSEKNAKLHRDLVLSPFYRERWPHVEIGKADVAKVRFFQNTAKGWRFSTSVGGPATGRHGDVLLFDDLAKAQDAEGRAAVDALAIEKGNDFWFKTMHTRRAEAETTAYVGIAQRLHHEDTPGRCIEAGYTALILPQEYDSRRRCRTTVLWTPPGATERAPFADPRTVDGELLNPIRFPREVVEADKVALGPRAYEAQAQQDPTPLVGSVFVNVGALRWKEVPRGARGIITVDCSFKTTSTSDYVAIQRWAVSGPHFYLIDQIHDRLNVAGTVAGVVEMLSRHGACAVHVEDKANGPAVLEALTAGIPGCHEWSPNADSKLGRAMAVAHLFAANVWLPPDERAPWIGKYLAELAKFPLTKHDDQVDATTMALLILWQPMISKAADAYRKMARGG